MDPPLVRGGLGMSLIQTVGRQPPLEQLNSSRHSLSAPL